MAKNTQGCGQCIDCKGAKSRLLPHGSYTPLPNNIWPNPSVYEALQVGVQGLLTGQKTIDQVLTDMDTAWGE